MRSKVNIYKLFFENKGEKIETQPKSIHSESSNLGDETEFRDQRLNATQEIESSPVSPPQAETLVYGRSIYEMKSWDAYLQNRVTVLYITQVSIY